jgi:glycosidase
MQNIAQRLGAVILPLVLSTAVQAAPVFQAPEPEDLIFYFIFIDRFANGSTSNDDGNPRAPFGPTNPTGFHGGDLAGIRSKLPYIKGLGVNAIWITPHVENVNNYHGYAAYNFYNVDPNFGTLAEMQQLVQEANAAGIAIYFDLVAGHHGDSITSSTAGYPGYRPPPDTYTLRWRSALRYPAPFNSLDHFHAHGHIGAFNAPEQELGELSGLDDLKTETQYVRDEMFKIWDYWLTQTGVSGFRVDTVKHVDLGFWEDFLPRLRARAMELGRENFFVFGELYGADDNYMRQYVGTLNGEPYKFDSNLDFQFYYSSGSVFATRTAAPNALLSRLTNRASRLPGHHHQTPNFIDNHDVQRFLHTITDESSPDEATRRLELALIALMTAPGQPVVYYGTEQRFDGGNDPNNRENMFDGQFEQGPSLGDNFDITSPQYQLISRLAAVRSAVPALRRGDLSNTLAASAGPGLLRYARRHGGTAALMMLNTHASASVQSAATTIPEFANRLVIDVLDPSQTLSIPASGEFPQRTIAPYGAELWIPEGLLPPAIPQVTGSLPTTGSRNIPLTLPSVQVSFLSPMDRVPTEAAFSIDPDTTYTVQWSADSRRLTATIDGDLAPLTQYTVALSTAAESSDGGALAFPFTARWTTAGIPRELPPLPATLGPVRPKDFVIVIDGAAGDWPASNATEGSGALTAGGTSVHWLDPIGDDLGAGAYTYPSNAVFSGDACADLRDFRVAYDADHLYLMLRPSGVNPSASFFPSYFGVAIDVLPGGDDASLGFNVGSGARGLTELEVRGDALPEYELAVTGPVGARLLDRVNGGVVEVEHALDPDTGLVEFRVPRADIGLEGSPLDQQISLIVYTSLETFGGVREIEVTRGDFVAGGGVAGEADPDVFDLLGVEGTQQSAELGDFSGLQRAQVVRGLVVVRLAEVAVEHGDQWMIR